VLVDVMLLRPSCGLAAAGAAGHRSRSSQHGSQSVTVSPGLYSSAKAVGLVFKYDSRNSPMNGGARSYRLSQLSQLNV